MTPGPAPGTSAGGRGSTSRLPASRLPASRLPAARRRAGAAGLLLGVVADYLVADPRSWHPVAGFGRAAGWVEQRCYAPTRRAGACHATLCVGAVLVAADSLRRATAAHPTARLLATAAATWSVLGGSSLAREAAGIAAGLQRGELTEARRRLPALCGRDPDALDGAGLARAAVESVAENTSDAVVAPLLWGALAGIPGLLGYRAVNTLDAMVGHRSPRYQRFGTVAARLDDAANLLPARLTATLTVATAPSIGGDPRRAWRSWQRDGARHPSPNAGRVEAAAAGALGVGLGGPLSYGGRTELRPRLGDGPAAGPADITRAIRLSRVVTVVAAALAVGASAAPLPAGWRRGTP